MANAPAVLAFVLLAATTAALLQWFADRRVPAHVRITTWLCWFMSFSIVLMIPLDVAAALGDALVSEGIPLGAPAVPPPIHLGLGVARLEEEDQRAAVEDLLEGLVLDDVEIACPHHRECGRCP